MIEYRTQAPSAQAYFALFETTGWNQNYEARPEDLARALANSQYHVAAYDGDRLVGFGRLVTDGVMHAMIYELIVDPGWQNQGIGSQVLDRLVDWCEQRKIHDIQLFCARGKRGFYEKRGFAARPEDAPGMFFHR